MSSNQVLFTAEQIAQRVAETMGTRSVRTCVLLDKPGGARGRRGH